MAGKKEGVLKKKDHTLEILTHIMGIFTYVFGALLVFILTEDLDARKHARNALNWQLSVIFYSFIFLVFSIIPSIIFFYAIPQMLFVFPFYFALSILSVLNIVFCVVASFKASEGVLWEYPLSIDIIGRIDPKVINKSKRELKKVYRNVKRDLKK